MLQFSQWFHVFCTGCKNAQAARWEREVEERNRPLTDEELESMLPGINDGYKV